MSSPQTLDTDRCGTSCTTRNPARSPLDVPGDRIEALDAMATWKGDPDGR